MIESALADELVAMTLEQTELLQRTGAGRPMGRRSRTWSTATRFRGPAGSPPPSAFALIIAGAARPAATTPPLGRLPWPRRYHNGLLDLVELDVLHDDLDKPEKPSP